MDSQLRVTLYNWRLNPQGMARRYVQYYKEFMEQHNLQQATEEISNDEKTHDVKWHPSHCGRPSTKSIVEQWKEQPEGMGRKYLLLQAEVFRMRKRNEELHVIFDGIDMGNDDELPELNEESRTTTPALTSTPSPPSPPPVTSSSPCPLVVDEFEPLPHAISRDEDDDDEQSVIGTFCTSDWHDIKTSVLVTPDVGKKVREPDEPKSFAACFFDLEQTQQTMTR